MACFSGRTIFWWNIVNLRDFNSPRNELESLHSVLEALNKSVCGENHTMKNIQQNLREGIVHMIHEVGNKFREETKIVGDYISACDKEKDLLDWGVENGVKTKLDIACESF